MVVELISVGTELLLGNTLNTNAHFLAGECAKLGFSLYHQVTVGDNNQRLICAIEDAIHRADIIILTGGLGPTKDDLTKEAVAQALDKELVPDEHSRELLVRYFNSRLEKEITENNYRQILKIEGSTVVDNDNGTAPGYIYKDDQIIIILLPGPPSEVIPMFQDKILPFLRQYQEQIIYSKMVKICGMGESKVETYIMDLINGQTDPTIAPYAKQGEVSLRITTTAHSEEEAAEKINPVIDELKARLGDYIFTINEEDTLESVVIKTLKDKNFTVSTAESCTGGLLSARITDVPGSSQVFKEGFITYSNDAKIENLNVDSKIIEEYGAISKQTAIAMANNLRIKTQADFALAVTGNAGPNPNEGKPNGLVYIACSYKENTIVEEYKINGSRKRVREYSTTFALNMLRKVLI